MNSRNLHIDTLRGIACILLVAFHVVGDGPEAGLKISSGPYRELNDLLGHVRMPLFTFLSGVVYAYRPLSGDIGKFVLAKLRRLILPMLVVGTSFALLQSLTQGTNAVVSNWYLLHIDPVAHYWFIESIFIIFMLMVPLELLGAFKKPSGYLLVLAGSIALFMTDLIWRYLGVSGAIYLFPYFLIGMGLQRFNLVNKLPVAVGWLLLGLVACAILLMAMDVFVISGKRSLPSLFLGTATCLGLLALSLRIEFLARIGLFSYSIYLFHVFFTAGVRIFLEMLGLVNIHLIFILALLTGLLGPVLAELVFDRWSVTKTLLLGKRSWVLRALR